MAMKIIRPRQISGITRSVPPAKNTTAKPGKRKKQAKETRERIYACADRLFREKGYDQTTVAEIAAAAGISVGGFYHHFKNKEEIMRLWISEFDVQYNDYYANVLCSPHMAGIDSLQKIRLMMITANKIFSSPGYMLSRISYSLMLRDASIGDMIVEPNRAYYRIIDELVKEAQEHRLIPPQLSHEEIVKDITTISRGCMVEWMLQNGADDLPGMIDKLLKYYLDSIAT